MPTGVVELCNGNYIKSTGETLPDFPQGNKKKMSEESNMLMSRYKITLLYCCKGVLQLERGREERKRDQEKTIPNPSKQGKEAQKL